MTHDDRRFFYFIFFYLKSSNIFVKVIKTVTNHNLKRHHRIATVKIKLTIFTQKRQTLQPAGCCTLAAATGNHSASHAPKNSCSRRRAAHSMNPGHTLSGLKFSVDVERSNTAAITGDWKEYRHAWPLGECRVALSPSVNTLNGGLLKVLCAFTTYLPVRTKSSPEGSKPDGCAQKPLQRLFSVWLKVESCSSESLFSFSRASFFFSLSL